MSGTRLGWMASQDRELIERCLNLKYYMTLHQQSRLDETVVMAALEPSKYWSLVRGTMDAAREATTRSPAGWRQRGLQLGAAGGRVPGLPVVRARSPFLGSLHPPAQEPYRTYLIPGSCYGYEGHVRFGFGPARRWRPLKPGCSKSIALWPTMGLETRPLAATA